jgi:hypothetical protein
MTRKTAYARLLVAGVVLGAALTGCTAAESASGQAPAGEPPSADTPSDGLAPVEGCSGALTTDIPPIEVDVRLVDGEAEPAPDRVDVPAGTTVVLRVEADTLAEVHVHGYDVAAEATPGDPACLEVLADSPGVYDVEAHPETLLLQLAVR